MSNKVSQLLAASVLLLACSPTWAKGPNVSIEIEAFGTLEADSVSIKGPRNSCDASRTEVSIEKGLDGSSAAIILAVANGTVFPSMTITIGGGTVWFENALMSSYSLGEGPDGTLESIAMSAQSVSSNQPPDCA